MLKVFLVEDESIMREGLRDNIPWQQYGYEFAGEASDGEMALPLIRKCVPDVLITDIKMPFMDGLELSELVTKEFPSMKVIIISGHDEFELARRAIQVGVEQYLLKPVTRAALQKVLLEIREKIESEQSQKGYLEKYEVESHEYEQFTRRHFLEKIFEGKLTVQEIYAEAGKLSLEINASSYNLMLFSIRDKSEGEGELSYSSGVIETIQRTFMKYTEYFVFRWTINTYGVLIMGEPDKMEELSEKAVSIVRRAITDMLEENVEWYTAISEPVERLSFIPDCYKEVNRIFAHRFLYPKVHVLNAGMVKENENNDSDEDYDKLDATQVDPDILKGFLSKGSYEEVDDFVESYLANLQEPLKSKLFRDYIVLNIRFIVLSYVQSLGISQNEFLSGLFLTKENEMSGNVEEIKTYMRDLLSAAVKVRDEQTDTQSIHILKKALQYIEDNFANENLSLNEVAGEVHVSPNYFSAVFSSRMNKTFVEYVTEKRMEKAKRLLTSTDKHSGEIALEVGYKDPHYFSFVFKKTQGVTPREYRNGTE